MELKESINYFIQEIHKQECTKPDTRMHQTRYVQSLYMHEEVVGPFALQVVVW